MQKEEQTVSMSICKWVVETEREPVVCVSFFYCLIERLAVCCNIINLDVCIVMNGVLCRADYGGFMNIDVFS